MIGKIKVEIERKGNCSRLRILRFIGLSKLRESSEFCEHGKTREVQVEPRKAAECVATRRR